MPRRPPAALPPSAHSAGKPAHSTRSAIHGALEPTRQRVECGRLRPLSGPRLRPPASPFSLLASHFCLGRAPLRRRRPTAADCEGAGLDGVSPHRRVLRPGRSPALPDCIAPQRDPTNSAGKPAHFTRSAIHGALEPTRQRVECGRLRPLAPAFRLRVEAPSGTFSTASRRSFPRGGAAYPAVRGALCRRPDSSGARVSQASPMHSGFAGRTVPAQGRRRLSNQALAASRLGSAHAPWLAPGFGSTSSTCVAPAARKASKATWELAGTTS